MQLTKVDDRRIINKERDQTKRKHIRVLRLVRREPDTVWQRLVPGPQTIASSVSLHRKQGESMLTKPRAHSLTP